MASSSSQAAPPLVARSADGSLVALHQPGGSTIRIYDGNASSGSLKFTLRVGPGSGGGGADASGAPPPPPAVRKLVFASHGPTGGGTPAPSLLCAVSGASSVVLYDLGRGVASQTVDVRDASGGSSKKSKKSKKASEDASAAATVADASSVPGRLDVLVRLPDADSGPGRCRLYQYDLSPPGGAARLVRKVKVGSASPAPGGGGAMALGVASSSEGGPSGSVAVRAGGRVRTFDGAGAKLARFDLPDELLLAGNGGADSDSGGSADGTGGIAPLLWDGERLALSSGRRVLVMAQRAEGGTARTIEAEALLEADDGAGPPTALEADGTHLVAFHGWSGAASLFSLGKGGKKKEGLVPVPPRATARIDGEAGRRASLVSAGFARRRGGDGGSEGGSGELQFLFRLAGGAAGSAAALPAETLGIAGLEGRVAVGGSLAGESGGVGRKRGQSDRMGGGGGGGVALAPGEQGQEADGAADLTSAKRARRAEGTPGAEEGEEEDGDDEKERSIAERLAMLSSAMERSDTEDDDDDESDPEDGGGGVTGGPPAGFRARSATSSTLTALLSQALGSNDAAQLNAALQVTDRRVVAGTVRSLQALDAARDDDDGGGSDGGPDGGLVPALMGHIVRRVARRHTLVMPLGVWIREVLAATARASASGASGAGGEGGRTAADGARDMAAKLGPLRNFLSERVECLPQLLRLEGRLALLGDQQL